MHVQIAFEKNVGFNNVLSDKGVLSVQCGRPKSKGFHQPEGSRLIFDEICTNEQIYFFGQRIKIFSTLPQGENLTPYLDFFHGDIPKMIPFTIHP